MKYHKDNYFYINNYNDRWVIKEYMNRFPSNTSQIYKFYNLLGAKMELNSDESALCMKYDLFLDEDNHLDEIEWMPFNTEVGRR